jgi:SAM-dependent methyltransferase
VTALNNIVVIAPNLGERAAAFDPIAEEYDQQFTHSVIGAAQRSLVHEVLLRRFKQGQRILELNCGTGEDALYLASQGISVLACDVSERMISVARRKAAHHDAGPLVAFTVCANERLDLLNRAGLFDGAFSNFGGLNCTADLAGVGRMLAEKVQPGGEVLLCLIGPICAWEVIWYCMQGKWSKAFRRMRKDGVQARIGDGSVRVYYPTVRAIRSAFSPSFRLREWRGIGVVLPPSFLEPFFCRRPFLIALLTCLDRWLGRVPLLRGGADHILLRFVREQ